MAWCNYRVAAGQPGGGVPAGVGGETLDCGNSGTGMRLLHGALGGRPAAATLMVMRRSRRGPWSGSRADPGEGATIETTGGHAPIAITGARRCERWSTGFLSRAPRSWAR